MLKTKFIPVLFLLANQAFSGTWINSATYTADSVEIDNVLEVTGTQSKLFLEKGDNPRIRMKRPSSDTDAKLWKLYISEDTSEFRGVSVNDADTQGELWLKVKRIGYNISSVNFENGDVGIGLDNPSAKLQVKGTNAGTNSINAYLGYENGGEKWAGYFDGNVGVYGNFQIDVNTRAHFTMDTTMPANSTDGAPLFLIQDDQNGSGDNPKIQLSKNAMNAGEEILFDMTWNGTALGMMGGKVGIGTNSPSDVLHLFNDAGDIRVNIHGEGNTPYTTFRYEGTGNAPPVNGDELGRIFWNTWDGYDWSQEAAMIAVIANGNHASNDARSDMAFYVNPGQRLKKEAMRISKDGHLGIGTSSPSSPAGYGGPGIEVEGNEPYIAISKTSGSDYTFGSNGAGLSFQVGSSQKMIWKDDGKVGIGTTVPAYLLDVAGDVYANGKLKAAAGLEINGNDPNSIYSVYLKSWSAIDLPSGRGYITFSDKDTTVPYMDIIAKSSATGDPQIRIGKEGGALGVISFDGTDIKTSHSVSVPQITTKKWKVASVSGGPDYVFQDDYDLLSLEEVENHIEEKGHLPGIKSAKKMEEEGIEMVEMNMKLLEKIEELTLHTIRQQQEINDLKSKIR